jgi:hypothetical protein
MAALKGHAHGPAARYAAREPLRDGRQVETRALKPDDQAELMAAVGHVRSRLWRRTGAHYCTVGGARYVALQPGTAELAFAFVDQYQGQSIGSSPAAPSNRNCMTAGITWLVATAIEDRCVYLFS